MPPDDPRISFFKTTEDALRRRQSLERGELESRPVSRSGRAAVWDTFSCKLVKRVDVFANLLHRGGTVDDLLDLEFAYAPPYAPAVDPLFVLGCAAGNQLDPEGYRMLAW